jgi:hypothetical protein
VNLRQQPFLGRLLLLIAAAGLGLVAGYVLGLAFILVVVSVFGHIDDTHPVRQLAVVGMAYAITGLAGLAAAILAWRRLFR